MNPMISTILSVKQLLKKEHVYIYYPDQAEDSGVKNYRLSCERYYNIPGYQREISWDTHNVQVLIDDLINRSKFLGHILVSTDDGKKFNLIDGQQRLTVFYMLFQAIATRDDEETFETCDFENESFEGLKRAIQNEFYVEDDKQKNECLDKDDLNQYEKYLELFQYVKRQVYALDQSQFIIFTNNLYDSDINLIIQRLEERIASRILCKFLIPVF